MTSLYQQLNGGNQPNNNMPTAPMTPMQMLQSDPNYNSVMREIQESGGDARSLFMKKVQQSGINPFTILSRIPKF